MKKKASDAWIAVSVIACSIVLFIALALGLSGRVLVHDGHAVRVRFHDITGIKVSSHVKYAGAPAGSVSGARMLTASERKTDPDHLVEVTLNLLRDVPPLTKSARVSIAADTLLSDKFVLVQDEGAGAPLLAEGEILNGITPTTFDKLARNVDDTLEGLRKAMGGDASANAKDLFSKIDRIVDDTQSLLTELKPVVKDAGLVVGDAKATMADARATMADARSLLSDNKERIGQAITRMDKAAASMEMSYRKDWLLVQGLQQTFGGAVVITETGGTAGGGAQLTDLGVKLIKAYRTIEVRAAEAAGQEMQMLAALVQKDARPRGRRAPKSAPA